jgi:hypothetical protein
MSVSGLINTRKGTKVHKCFICGASFFKSKEHSEWVAFRDKEEMILFCTPICLQAYKNKQREFDTSLTCMTQKMLYPKTPFPPSGYYKEFKALIALWYKVKEVIDEYACA